MNQDEFEAQRSTASNLPLPGQLVRQTREQRQLSLQDLSEKTRLTENVLAALERDEFDALGEPVYARGYYRKCGQALNLNAEALVESYEEHSGTGSPVPTIDQRPSIAYREGPGKTALGIALGLMLLVFLLCGWWMWGEDQPKAATLHAPVPDVTPQPATRVGQQAPAVQPRVPSQQPGNRPAQAAAAQPGAAVQADSATPQSRSAASEDDVDNPQAIAAASQPLAATATPSPSARPVATPVAAIQTPLLRVEISGGEAWVDVRDRNGDKLLYKLLQDGNVREVQGRAPLRVSLGRADHVRILLNGRSVDLSQQIDTGLRASFLLDASGRLYDVAEAEEAG